MVVIQMEGPTFLEAAWLWDGWTAKFFEMA